MERYYDSDLAAKSTAAKNFYNMDEDTEAVLQILLYFAYESTSAELNALVTLRNRDFLIDLMSYKIEEDKM